MSKIRLSDKHGLNPSIAVCFFCGKDKGLVVLGKMKGDVKAPKRAVFDYAPCEECLAKMKQGTTVIEVTRVSSDAPQIADGAWPTGRWCVISKESARALFKTDNSIVLLNDNLYEELHKKLNKENK